MLRSLFTALSVTAFLAAPALAANVIPDPHANASYGAELEGFDYPYPVQRYRFSSQGQALQMAYMDVQPSGKANGRTMLLLHGKNFCGATWDSSIEALSDAGYRVLVPDQIGFCKSSKPEHYQYTFQQLANNTHALLQSLGIDQVTVLGHSTGGMLGIRYSLMYPQEVQQLALVNPIGLEDWKAKGVPSITVDQWYARELKVNAAGIRDYERNTYYAGQWREDYEPWVQMLAGLNRGPGHRLVAWNSALLYDMIYTQPVVYELPQLKMPVLLLIGDKDNTAIGKDLAAPEIRSQLGNYPVLAHEAARQIPHVKLIEFPDYGHAPQMQDPAAFHKALLGALQ